METDIPFAVDADVDARELSRGQSASAAARQQIQQTAEEVPLLSDTSAAPGAGLRDDVIDPSLDQPWLGSKEFEDQPRWRRPSIWWLIPPMFVFTTAFGGIVVPRLNLILNLVCRDYLADRAAKDPRFTYLPVIFGEDNDQCRTPEVQSLAAIFMLYLNLAVGLLSAIVSPRLGDISDRYGRKTLMALSSLTTLLGEAFAIIVASRPESSPAYLLLVGAFIDGLGGSFTAAIALVHAYASDCTPPEKRNVVFGYFHATIFSGVALGPFLFGLMIKLTGSVLAVFYTVAGCHLFYFIFIALVIPESVSKDRQRAARERHRVKHLHEEGGLSIKDLNPINILRPLRILFPKFERSELWSLERRQMLVHLRRNLILLASIDTLMFGVAMGTMQIIVLYAEYMFGWGNYESSVFLSVTSTGRVIVLLVLLPIMTRFTRGRQRTQQTNSGSDQLDIGVIQLSIIFDLAGYIGYSLAGAGGVFLLSAVVASVGGMGSPTLQSSLTKHVPPSHTGQILGAVGLLHALARVVLPVIFNLIYSRTVKTFPQTVFVCLASVFGLVLILSWFIVPNVYLPGTPPPSRPGETVEDEDEEDMPLAG